MRAGGGLALLGLWVLGFSAINAAIGLSMYGERGRRNRAALRDLLGVKEPP